MDNKNNLNNRLLRNNTRLWWSLALNNTIKYPVRVSHFKHSRLNFIYMILLQRKGNIHQLSGRNVMLRTALTVTSSRQTLSVKGIPLINCQVMTVGFDRSRQIYDKLTGWQYYLNLLLTIVTEKNLRQWNLAAEKLTQVFFSLVMAHA